MMKNKDSFPLAQKMHRARGVQFQKFFIEMALLTAYLCGCANDSYRGALRATSSGSTSANYYQGIAYDYRSEQKNAISAEKRAAYWQKRGYNFDPHEISAEGMDTLAVHYTPLEWLEAANRARAAVAQDKAARKAEAKLEAVNAAAARKAQRENAANDSTRAVRTEPPRPIVPSAKPLPPLGQP